MSVVGHSETASSTFSLCEFPWREVKLRAAPSFPAKKAPADQLGGEGTRGSGKAGGFGYSGSSLVSSTCRNRFILWHYSEGHLKLLEVSLDTALAHNALDLVLEGDDHLLPDVAIQECEHSDIVILFCTTSTAYRLVLPHPEKIAATPSMCAVGEGKVPSIFSFASADKFIGTNMAAVFNEPKSVVPLTACAAGIDPNGVVTFALSSPTGGIMLIQLPPTGQQGLPVRSELRETSVMGRLWSSLLPVVGRGGGGAAEDAPVSVLLHMFEGQAVVVALCADLNLRLWSVQLGQCVLVHDISEIFFSSPEEKTKAEQLRLRAAPDSSSTDLKFAVYFKNAEFSQISIFVVTYVSDKLLLQPIHSYLCPQKGVLVDFAVQEREVWVEWVCPGEEGEEGDRTVLQQATYSPPLECTGWRDVQLTPLPRRDLTVLPHLDPREFFLEVIFLPGRFSKVAILKTLELYESPRTTADMLDLRKEVTIRVEHELQSSAATLELDSQEYYQLSLRCWSKFYNYCLEYQELVSKPLGVFQDPGTGMGLLLKHGVVSFVRPAEISEGMWGPELSLLQIQDVELQQHTSKFLSTVKNVVKQLSPDLMDSFLLELGRHGNPDATPPIQLAEEMADVIHDEGWDDSLYSDLCAVRDVGTILDVLLEVLDPIQEGVAGGVVEALEDTDDYSELRMSLSRIFSAPLSLTLLGATFRETCYLRVCLCRDILIVLLLMRRGETTEFVQHLKKDYNVLFSRLLQSYFSLYWLATQTAIIPASSALDTNLQQFAALAISGGCGGHTPSHPSPTLPLLYLSTRGHQEVIAELARERVLPVDVGLHPHWRNLVPRVIDILIRSLWPTTSCSRVAEFLLDNNQYTHLQDYVKMILKSYVTISSHSLFYLLGRAYVCVGELEGAYECFMKAYTGLGLTSEPLLQSLVKWEESDQEGGVARYFEKVMRLFEQVPAPEYVIRIADSAATLLDKGHHRTTIFWSNLFKHHLDLGHAVEAYHAMTSNPDHTLRLDCLRRMVVVLTEQNRIRELCKFSYTGMEREIEGVMEARARSVDVGKHNYYDLLYCYHTHRHNFRKAAYVMHEYGLRLGRETSGLRALKKQSNCYSVCIQALHLTDPKYAFVVRPVQEGKGADSRHPRRKRTRPNKKDKVPVEVLTIADLENEYLLVRAKLDLLLKEPSLTTQLSSPFVSPEDVNALLIQAGMFDAALNLTKRFSLPVVPIFESLASRCIHFSAHLATFDHQTSDKTAWEWLNRNEGLDVSRARESSIADKAWGILRTALERVGPVEQAQVQRCVAKKLLSMGRDLPQWLLDNYKRTNPAELLRLYFTFDLLEQALLLAMEYIDAVMGHGKEFFGLKNALHSQSPSVWLPHSTFAQLKQVLSEAPLQPELDKLFNLYSDKMEQYLQKTVSVTRNMEFPATVDTAQQHMVY